MASGLITQALDGLTTAKGAAMAGVAILGLAGLLHVARTDTAPASARLAAPAASQLVKAAAAVDPSGSFTPAQVGALQAIIKDYLISNPEVMVEITKEIEKRQQLATIAEDTQAANAPPKLARRSRTRK